jgi:uncharacterized protein
MLKRTVLTGLLSATLLVAARAQSTDSPSQKPQKKIAIQMSDNDPVKWNLALSNAKNVQDELGAANVEIEIVAFGPGIQMLKLDSAVNSRIGEASKAGVKVLACENSMRNLKVSKDDIAPTVGYVPAGVVHLMRRQTEGWAYLRP